MSDRSHMLSGLSVGVAVVGSAIGNLALSGRPIARIIDSRLDARTSSKADREKSELLDHYKARIFQLETELAISKAEKAT